MSRADRRMEARKAKKRAVIRARQQRLKEQNKKPKRTQQRDNAHDYFEPSLKWGILFIFINLALTATIAIFPGRALFDWIHQAMIRFINDGALIGFDPISIPHVLLFPIIGAIIIDISSFYKSCDPREWLSLLLLVAFAAICLSLAFYAVVLFIPYIIIKPFAKVLYRYGRVGKKLLDGYSNFFPAQDAIKETEHFMKNHKLLVTMAMLQDDDDD